MKATKYHRAISIFFFVVGIVAIIHLWFLTTRFSEEHVHLEQTISCQDQLISVLQTRSDARIIVDQTSHDANIALESLLADLIDNGQSIANLGENDLHLVEAKEDVKEAAQARNNPNLWKPYPQCWLQGRDHQ